MPTVINFDNGPNPETYLTHMNLRLVDSGITVDLVRGIDIYKDKVEFAFYQNPVESIGDYYAGRIHSASAAEKIGLLEQALELNPHNYTALKDLFYILAFDDKLQDYKRATEIGEYLLSLFDLSKVKDYPHVRQMAVIVFCGLLKAYQKLEDYTKYFSLVPIAEKYFGDDRYVRQYLPIIIK